MMIGPEPNNHNLLYVRISLRHRYVPPIMSIKRSSKKAVSCGPGEASGWNCTVNRSVRPGDSAAPPYRAVVGRLSKAHLRPMLRHGAVGHDAVAVVLGGDVDCCPDSVSRTGWFDPPVAAGQACGYPRPLASADQLMAQADGKGGHVRSQAAFAPGR